MSFLSKLSRQARLRKRLIQNASSAKRRRKLVAGMEPLEDRRLLAISTSFAAGVLTFTGDFGGVSDDKVILQSTGTAGTVNYDDGAGLGSTTLAGVNSVLFNAGGGKNEMIIINEAPSVFRPAAGPSFNIQYNVANDPDFDVLRVAGGSAATILSGNYTVSSPTSGTISYATTFTPINIAFSGLSSTGGTPDRVDDTTIQGGAFTTNSSAGAENITVKVGPVLPPVQSFVQGPVFVDGGDRDDHGSFSAGVNHDGWLFMQQALSFVYNSKVATFGGVSGAGTKNVLAIGLHGGQAQNAFTSAAALAKPGGLTFDIVTGAAISTVNFSNYDLIYVPSNSDNTGGGIDGPESDLLAARATGPGSIQNYVRAGGGIVSLTDADSNAVAGPFGWLKIPTPFSIIDFTAGGISDQLRKTPEAIAAGFTISDAELTNGIPYHNVFTGPAGFNGLDVFVKDTGGPSGDHIAGNADAQNVTLGQGSINDTVGGGPTTTISGNQMTLINLGNKPGLSLNALGGTDAISVDGSVLSLDGLLAPLTINGGGNGDSLSITDSADASGDIVSVTSLSTTGLAAFPITYSGIGSLSVQATQGADTMNVDVSPAAPGLTSVTVLGGLSGDLFTGPTGYMRPSSSIALNVHGGTGPATPGPGLPFNPFGELGDKFNLDMTTRADGTAVAPIVIVDTNGGNAISANTQLVRFTGIENIDVLDGGVLTNTEIGDFYLRGTGSADYIEFRSAAQVNPVFRVRVGNTYYPSSTGNFGPYTTGSSKVYVYGRGGNDTITMYNTRLNGVIFGEAGDDVLTGGYGNDLIIGGQGNDRLNGGAVGGNDEVWGDDFDPVLNNPSVASQAAGGNDQINTFGGNDTVYGQGGNDIINTGDGADYINGGLGDDQIDGQAGNDRIYGGAGADVIQGSAGNDVVAGNAGADKLYGRIGNDIVIGGLGRDLLTGDEGGDALVGDESSGAGSGSLAKGDAADAALLILLNSWGTTPALGSISGFGSSGNDGSVDTLWGGTGADAFFTTGTDVAADRNAFGYGPDLN